jgi:hypothetical protein
MKQRSEYSLRLRGLKSQLTDERVEKLDSIGFSWVAPNFKRKVGVGIAPGSPAANVAAAMQPDENDLTKTPPMEKNHLGEETIEHHALVPKPAAAPHARPQAPPLQQHHEQQPLMQNPQTTPNPTPQEQEQQLGAPIMLHHQQQEQMLPSAPAQQVHHQHHPAPLDAPDGFQGMHHDPHQLQHHQHMHHTMNPHHDSEHPQTMHPHHHQQQHDAAGDDIVNMAFL